MLPRQTNFTAIGTKWSVAVNKRMTTATWSELVKVIHQRIESFDKNYSRFRPDSLVTAMNQTAGIYELPPDGFKMLKFYEDLYLATDGQITPLIGQVMSDAGYDANYSLQTKKLAKPPQWETVISYDQHFIKLKQPALLDFGAAGKGYLVDLVSGILEAANITDYTINAGGDIRQRSLNHQAIIVGLENPQNTRQVIGTIKLNNKSLAASAGSHRTWGKFMHLINPTTLKSPRQVIASWAMADDTMTADGLATALFFTPPNQLNNFIFDYAVLNQNMSLSYSANFPVQLFEAAKV